MADEPPLYSLTGKIQSPIWVVLSKGINTQGGRVCWMPAEFRKTVNGQTYRVSAKQLQDLKGYELRPSTNQEWLQKGIRFENVDLCREEINGPAAQLVVFQDHPVWVGLRSIPTILGRLTSASSRSVRSAK